MWTSSATARDVSKFERGQSMKIRQAILLSALSLPLIAGASFAADSNRSLVDAAKAGDRAAVQALLDAGKDANAAQPDGTTALFWAATRNDVQLVERRLRAGADVKATNDYGA